jgi:hypothetical protein
VSVLLGASQTLTDAGSIAAIVAGTVAVALLCWGVGRWFWTRALALDIDHGLHVVDAMRLSDVKVHIGDEALELRVGVELRNGASVPLTFLPSRFTVSVAGSEFPLTERGSPIDIAPGQQTGWYKDAVKLDFSLLPSKLGLEFEIEYKRRGGRAIRCLSGGYELTFHRPAPLQAGQMSQQPVHATATTPVRDTRIKRRHAFRELS